MLEKENPLKVAFVGTSCAGKTTILNEYRDRNDPSTAIVEEAARTYFTEHPEITDRFGKVAQREVQLLALQNEQKAHSSGARIILCDRSVIDAVVYVSSYGDKAGANELLDRVSFWLPTYDKFLLLDPLDVPYENDDVRQEDQQTRQKFHDAFLTFFSETGISFELLSGSLDKRTTRVDEILNSC